MVGMEEGRGVKRPFFTTADDLWDEEYYDDQMPEKKRRLTAEQVCTSRFFKVFRSFILVKLPDGSSIEGLMGTIIDFYHNSELSDIFCYNKRLKKCSSTN